jgi:hypothetical protein
MLDPHLMDDIRRAISNEQVFKNFLATINSFSQVR